MVQHPGVREVADALPRAARAAVTPRRAVWITWQRHRRTREICRALGVELVELTFKRPRALRYPVVMAQTVLRLARTRPDVVFIQCPSVILGVWAGLLKTVFGFTLVADLHNEAVQPFICTRPAYKKLLAWIARAADVCLVTNDPLKAVVERNGATAFVLPDRVPELGGHDHHIPTMGVPNPDGGVAGPGLAPYAVFVCTYAPDEPYREVFAAAAMLDPAVTVYVTGTPPASLTDVVIPSNVQLTGFLAEGAYEELIRGAGVIVDLTLMDDCLVCGAYEAVAVGRPLVTSDTPALRAYFSRGAVYTAHDPRSLATAITTALAQRARLAEEMRSLKPVLREDWARQGKSLQRLLHL